MTLRGWRVVLSVTIAVSCSEAPGDLFTIAGTVRGTVSDPTFSAVANAWVIVDGQYPLGNGRLLPMIDSTRTDDAGRFIILLGTVKSPDADVAFTMRVRPSPESALAGRDTSGISVRVAAKEAERGVAIVDVALPASLRHNGDQGAARRPFTAGGLMTAVGQPPG